LFNHAKLSIAHTYATFKMIMAAFHRPLNYRGTLLLSL
jgi:hypothetical protein